MEDTLGKTLNEKAVQHNSFIVEYCRTSVAVLAGVTAGILGLTGLVGFGLYLVFSQHSVKHQYAARSEVAVPFSACLDNQHHW